MNDPQLGGLLLYVIVLVYLAACLWLLSWAAVGLTRGYRTWRARRPAPADDDRPADADATLAGIYAAMDAREEQP